MILGEIRQAAGIAATLDDLFRRAGVRHPDALALVDPPNRSSFTDGPPRSLSYAQADHAISAFASRLRGLGLQADAVVALQLPNTVDSIIALLGVLRAGMIAAPLPLLWRRHEIVDALRRAGAKAIITCARVGDTKHAEIAVHAAAELFPIRHICSFGENVPDGVVSTDDIFTTSIVDASAAQTRSESAAAHVAAVTFNVGALGAIPVARNHIELISGGVAVLLESGVTQDARLLSTIPVSTFAGMALTLVPWLLSGGTLHLHHGFDLSAFAAQLDAAKCAMLTLPAPALASFGDAAFPGHESCVVAALWRAPERLRTGSPQPGTMSIVDVSSFGEVGIVAARRETLDRPVAIPHGVISVPRGAIGAMTVIETARANTGTLLLRGPMVPTAAFPPGAGSDGTAHLAIDRSGYVDTGFVCRLDVQTQSLTVTMPPPGMFNVGGYYLCQGDVDACVGKAAPDAAVVPLPDRNLGHRLAGTAIDRNNVAAALERQGANALIAGAFRRIGAGQAA
ncbi:MAG TPA: class I adenylate-forming enzyme family protein [Pseudolabrys sp.]|nr:class I adenylate-forming enzyme family protein [Pseudolabrys sp.]